MLKKKHFCCFSKFVIFYVLFGVLAFNYELLDPVIDFYVIKTINFRRCKKKTPMSRMNTKGDMVSRYPLKAMKKIN